VSEAQRIPVRELEEELKEVYRARLNGSQPIRAMAT